MVATGDKIFNVPRIGETAPLFDAMTTQGPMKLDEFRGRWLVLFSHPADFTPVCTTEFIALAKLQLEFKARGVELLGLSIDSLPSHIAWIRNIEEKTGVKINFPVIADLDHYIAMLYGMVHPGEDKTTTVRCVFFIDPKQIVRAILYYPVDVGRNTQEILRLIDALQAAEKYSIATPADWKPGEKIILPTPQTQQDAEDRMKDRKVECIDWYLCKEKLD